MSPLKNIAEFSKTTLIGGLLIVLPLYLSILLLAKTIKGLLALIAPVTSQLPPTMELRQVVGILLVLLVCFVAGLLVRTGPGSARQERHRTQPPRAYPRLCAHPRVGGPGGWPPGGRDVRGGAGGD